MDPATALVFVSTLVGASIASLTRRTSVGSFYNLSAEELSRRYASWVAMKTPRVTWYVEPGEGVWIEARYLRPMFGNLFAPAKLAAVRSAVLEGEASFIAGYGQVSRITVQDVEEALRYDEAIPWTTGHPHLDRYLASAERDDDPDPELEEELEEAEAQGDGDLGQWMATVRDGNHRTFGAIAAGEDRVAIRLYDNDVQDLKQDFEKGIVDDLLAKAIEDTGKPPWWGPRIGGPTAKWVEPDDVFGRTWAEFFETATPRTDRTWSEYVSDLWDDEEQAPAGDLHPVDPVDPDAPGQVSEFPARVRLVKVGPQVRGTRGRALRDVGKAGYLVPEAADALNQLADACANAGIDLQISSAFRDYHQQAEMYRKHRNWIAAGRPAKGSARFDSRTMKAEGTGPPGVGMHQSGRAIDISLSALQKSGTSLADFWKIAARFGWRPFPTVKRPDPSVDEAWHFDFYGELEPVFKAYGYADGMKAASVDVGLLGPQYKDAQTRGMMGLQAHLARAGFPLGSAGIDGRYGETTDQALKAAGIDPGQGPVALFRRLLALPSAGKPQAHPRSLPASTPRAPVSPPRAPGAASGPSWRLSPDNPAVKLSVAGKLHRPGSVPAGRAQLVYDGRSGQTPLGSPVTLRPGQVLDVTLRGRDVHVQVR